MWRLTRLQGWLNSREVQEALGVPLNWTADPIVTEIAFIYGTGDAARQDAGHLKRVLDAGVKVAMVFGDVDHRCNCTQRRSEHDGATSTNENQGSAPKMSRCPYRTPPLPNSTVLVMSPSSCPQATSPASSASTTPSRSRALHRQATRRDTTPLRPCLRSSRGRWQELMSQVVPSICQRVVTAQLDRVM